MPDFLADILTRPENYSYALGVETAYKLSLPPTVFILSEKQPSDGWDEVDKKLAIAWTVLQKETCPKCQNPLWICRSSNKNLGFAVRKGICYATAEVENKANKKKAENLKPGEFQYVVPEMIGDESLPTREEWIKEMNEE